MGYCSAFPNVKIRKGNIMKLNCKDGAFDKVVAGNVIHLLDEPYKALEGIGRTASDIRGIVLTHAHPDHIGSAAWFQEHTDCRIYASVGEKR